ncbi:hypothetical protein [Mumia zhuanghuii]|uniref:hypothetical protein n=1 Tax=Mumia zhuanghuii TaxID=2585211 RepID=UPI00129C9772|nr:hypothetical protein [Mumia zhuanghuii]
MLLEHQMWAMKPKSARVRARFRLLDELKQFEWLFALVYQLLERPPYFAAEC